MLWVVRHLLWMSESSLYRDGTLMPSLELSSQYGRVQNLASLYNEIPKTSTLPYKTHLATYLLVRLPPHVSVTIGVTISMVCASEYRTECHAENYTVIEISTTRPCTDFMTNKLPTEVLCKVTVNKYIICHHNSLKKWQSDVAMSCCLVWCWQPWQGIYYQPIEDATKWPLFRKRRFQMLFLGWKYMNFD